jgi:hypothetical protein
MKLSAAALRSENSPARFVRAGGFAFLALFVAGVAFRVWIVLSPLGLVDGDEAVVGLMARDALHLRFSAFFWGQAYGGSLEALLVAALLALRVPGRVAMEVVPIGLHGLGAWLVWRVGLRTVSARAASLGAGLCWAASPALVWWSTKERGFYGVTLVCGLLVLLLALRLADERVPWWEAAALGIVAGVGWWSSPQVLHFLVPAGTWLVWRLRARSLRLVPLGLVGAALGALPWIWANVGSGFASLDRAPDRWVFGGPFEVFFVYGLPMVLGLRRPIRLVWELPGAKASYVVVLVGLVAAIALRRPRRAGIVLLAVAAYPLLFAALPTTYYYGEPRYLDFLWPLLALLGGAAIAALPHPALRAGAVAGVLALAANGVAHLTQLEGPPGQPYEDISPRPTGPLVRALDRAGIDHVYADYWVAYRLTWESHGRITATPLQPVRSTRLDGEVRRAGRVAYVTTTDSCLDDVVDPATPARAVDVWSIRIPSRPGPPASTQC